MKTKQKISLVIGMTAGLIASAAGLSVCAEEEATGTVTVTIYDGETGELFQPDDTRYVLMTGNYDKRPKFGSFMTVSEPWNVTDGNPYTVTDIQIRPEWVYFLELLHPADAGERAYYYEIDESRSPSEFKFADSTEQTLEIYLVKHYREGTRGGFWVYLGEDETDHAPVFAHYYLSEDGRNYRHPKVTYRGAMDIPLSYGDILETADIVNPVKGVLNEDVAWTKKGNCSDIADIRVLTVGNDNIRSKSTPDSRWMVLYDNETYFCSLTAYVDHYQPDISLEDVMCGDTIKYAVYENIPILPLSSPEHHHPAGDVSADNLFRLSDIVLMQKWLLSVPDTELTDWKAGDLNGDGKLTAADLTMMKRELLAQELKPHCKLTLTTTQTGWSVMGEELEPRVYQDSFTVYAGDRFTEEAGWEQNSLKKEAMGGVIAVIDDISEESVSLRLYDQNGTEKTVTAAYGAKKSKGSNVIVFDGYNSSYTLVFSDYSADGMTCLTPPEKMPVISCRTGSVSEQECQVLWEALQYRFPETDLSAFSLHYDPEHPMGIYINGKVFRIFYKGIQVHGYGDLNWDSNAYARIAKTEGSRLIVDVEFLMDPQDFEKIDTDADCLSKEEISQLYQQSLFDSEPERIIYVDMLHNPKSPELKLAYKIVYAEMAEIIVDAVTGEQIEIISYVVP